MTNRRGTATALVGAACVCAFNAGRTSASLSRTRVDPRAAAAGIAGPAADSARHRLILTAPRESLHVVVEGEGPPVVLIPGLFGSAFGFRKVVPLLTAAGYRTIIVEPLGFGTSGRPTRADYSLTAQADRLAAALDTLATGPVIVVGHSIGGSIAFRLSYRHPALVQGVISIEGGPTERATTASFARAMRFAPLIRVIGGMKLIRHQLRRGLIAASGDTTWVTASVIQGYTAGAAADLSATLRAYRAMGASRELELLRPHLSEITCPVRMLVGDAPHDGRAPREEIELLRHALRSFAVDDQPGAGHYIFEERPEAIVASVRRLRGSGS